MFVETIERIDYNFIIFNQIYLFLWESAWGCDNDWGTGLVCCIAFLCCTRASLFFLSLCRSVWGLFVSVGLFDCNWSFFLSYSSLFILISNGNIYLFQRLCIENHHYHRRITSATILSIERWKDLCYSDFEIETKSRDYNMVWFQCC